jgi:hypothetical protein
MVRENNMKVFAPQAAAEEPKFGAGSAFGKDQKVCVKSCGSGIRCPFGPVIRDE